MSESTRFGRNTEYVPLRSAVESVWTGWGQLTARCIFCEAMS